MPGVSGLVAYIYAPQPNCGLYFSVRPFLATWSKIHPRRHLHVHTPTLPIPSPCFFPMALITTNTGFY